MSLDVLITGVQAARLVGVSRQLIRRWEQLGHLIRIDGRYRAADILAAERTTRRSHYYAGSRPPPRRLTSDTTESTRHAAQPAP